VSYEESIIKQLLGEMSQLEDQKPGKFSSFNLLLAIAESLEFDDFDSAAVGIDDGEVEYAIGQMLDRGWAESNNEGVELQQQSFRISSKGKLKVASSVDYAEIFQQPLDEPYIDPDSPIEYKSEFVPRPHDSVSMSTASEPEITAHPPTFDSSGWTGLPANFVLTQTIQAKLVGDLDRAEVALATVTVSQYERSQARAYIIAMRALAEAPDPQVDLIWEILGRVNQKSGIASFFVSIMALFASVAH
jgi:hypothetical protein